MKGHDHANYAIHQEILLLKKSQVIDYAIR